MSIKAVSVFFVCFLVIGCSQEVAPIITEPQEKIESSKREERLFSRDNLMTNTSKKSIELSKIYDGGPGKDGIPAINTPQFLSIVEAKQDLEYLSDGSQGLAVDISGEVRYYPYDILVWHEIVNDSIGDTDFAVTFCPLCGSGIVYDRNVEGQEVSFGVSGKLYESNLLMYDSITETLWSQSLGKGVVGDYTDTKLTVIKSHLLTWKQFQTLYPEGKVLSDDTGYRRQYGYIPYGDYDTSDTLYFPVTNIDARLPKKEILYIVNDGDTSVAFVLADLVKVRNAELEINNATYTASYNNGLVDVIRGEEELPGYYEMWFSWVNHNVGSKNIWIGEDK